MKCSQCGAELSEYNGPCPMCRQESSVKILSRVERDSFTGETIEASTISSSPNENANNGRNRTYEHYGRHNSSGLGRRVYKFSLLPSTFWGRAALVLATGLLFFVALPLFFLAVLFGTIIGMLFFKKK